MDTTDATEDDVSSLLELLTDKPGTSRDVANECTPDYFDEGGDFVEIEMMKMKMGISQFGNICDSDDDNNDNSDYFTLINYNEDEFQLPKLDCSELPLSTVGRKQTASSTKKIKLLERALEFNIELQHMLQKFENELVLKLESVKEELNSLRKASISAMRDDSQQELMKKFTYMRLKIPYFKDAKNFPCPSNEDYLDKVKKDALIVIDLPKIKFWNLKDILKLEVAVKDCIITEFKNRIESKKTVMVDKVQKGDENLGAICKEICILKKKQDACRKKPVHELLKDYPQNREFDWLRISALCFGNDHSEIECQKFWHLYGKPSINKSRWSIREDENLIEIARKHKGQNWELIAKELNTSRSQYQCFIHYQTRLNYKNTLHTGPFSKEEDNKILFLVKACRKGDYIPWVKIAHHIRTRTPLQIRNRYMCALKPDYIKGRFTENEDLFIVSGRLAYGFGFAKLAELLQNRSPSQVRDRFYRATCVLRTKIGSWTLEEDKRLMELVKIYGEKNWSKISKHICTRSRTQIRQHYNVIRKKNYDIYKVARHNAKLRKNVEQKTKTLKTSDQIKEILDKVPGGTHLTDAEKQHVMGENLNFLLNRNLRRHRKKISKEQPHVEKQLTEFFMESSSQLCVKKRNLEGEFDSVVRQMHAICDFLLVNVSGENVQDKIKNSSHMDDFLKKVLLKVSEEKEIGKNMSLDVARMCSSIDYVPNQDLCIVFHEPWLLERNGALVNNFSELLKAPLMEYAPGLHKDILDNIMKNSKVIIRGSSLNTVVSECDENLMIPFVLPPTYLSENSMRTLMLSRRKFEKVISHNKQYFDPDCFAIQHGEDDIFKRNFERKAFSSGFVLNMPASRKFEERLLTLFHWPTVASLCTPPNLQKFCQEAEVTDMELQQTELDANTSCQQSGNSENSNKYQNEKKAQGISSELLKKQNKSRYKPGFSFLRKYKKRRKLNKNCNTGEDESNN